MLSIAINIFMFAINVFMFTWLYFTTINYTPPPLDSLSYSLLLINTKQYLSNHIIIYLYFTNFLFPKANSSNLVMGLCTILHNWHLSSSSALFHEFCSITNNYCSLSTELLKIPMCELTHGVWVNSRKC